MNRNKIIAVDFDGVLCENRWPDIGLPKEAVIEYIKNEKRNGACVILWTCRVGKELADAIEWSNDQGVFFDTVNRNLNCVIKTFGGDSRKIFAHEYIDDRNKLVSQIERGENFVYRKRPEKIFPTQKNLKRMKRFFYYGL